MGTKKKGRAPLVAASWEDNDERSLRSEEANDLLQSDLGAQPSSVRLRTKQKTYKQLELPLREKLNFNKIHEL